MQHHEVVIIGAGPAGLATAIALHERGLKDVVVLDREEAPGGNLIHTNHTGFAPYKNYGRWTGPQLAAELAKKAKAIDIRCKTTVLEFTLRGAMRVHNAQGVREMTADKIVLATGAREAAPSTRLFGGRKLQGIMTTGELQRRVYLHGEQPFKKPVIIGSEWISYSSFLTCRHFGARPVAMIAEDSRHNAPGYFALATRFIGTRFVKDAELVCVLGNERVEAITIKRKGKVHNIACDGVIFSGHLRPESALYTQGFIDREGHVPKVTQQFKTSRENIYAIGNVLGQVETAGACMLQGRNLAKLLRP